MKQLLAILLLTIPTLFFISSCDKEEDKVYDYEIMIMSPNNLDKNVGDSIHLHINFESKTMEPVHHIKVRIYNESTGVEVYNAPSEAHVHEMDGYIEHHADFFLNNDNGVDADSDWILEARVWGHDAGAEEVMDTLKFHVHP